MNPETLVELASAAQMGDIDAMEQLLLWAYTPVSFLCQKLLKDDEIAQEQTYEILRFVAQKVHTIQDPAMFEKWLIRITSARCVQIQERRGLGDSEEVAETKLPIAGEELDEMQTVDAVQQMVDMLPAKPRTCITLLCCCEMHSNDIAQLTGYSVEEVKENMAFAQNFVLEQLGEYQQQGTEFYPITSLTDVLQSGMRYEREDAAVAVVYGILGKPIPKPVDPNRGKKILLWAAIVVLILVNLALVGIDLLVQKKNTFDPADYSAVVVEIPTEATQPEATEAIEISEEPAEFEEGAESGEPEETTPETKSTKEEKQESQEPTTATTAPAATQTSSASKPSTLGPGKEVPAAAPSTGEDGHTHRYLTTKTNFNCETGGTRRYECADCDYYYTEDMAASGKHNLTMVPNAAAANATCTASGKAYQICTKCNYAANVDDPAKPPLGHNYESSTVAPTATEQGYTLHKCSRCGDSYKDNYVDAFTPAESQETQAPPADNEVPAEDT